MIIDELHNGLTRKARALNSLFKEILKETDNAIYSVYHTVDKSRDGYDCLAIQYSKETGEKTKKMFFEVVMSDNATFIEKQKLESLKGLIINDKMDKIYCVNFTPDHTIIFDLLKIGSGLIFTEQDNKEIAYLDDIDGTFFDHIHITEVKSQEVPQSENDAFPKEEPVITEITSEPGAIVNDNNSIKSDNLPTDWIIAPEPIEPIQTELEISPEAIKRIKLDDNGEITFSSLEEFETYPRSIQCKYVNESFMRNFLEPGESKDGMIEKYGTLEKACLFMRERTRRAFLARFNFFDTRPNKYDIK